MTQIKQNLPRIKFLRREKIKGTAIFLLLCVLLLSSAPVSKAESPLEERALLYFGIDKASFFDPEYLYLSVNLNSSSTIYNLIDFTIKYDNTYLELAEANIASSCPVVLREVEADNDYTLTCGNFLNFKSEETIASLKFKKLREGQTKLNFNHALTFTADGFGQAMPANTEAHNIFIVKN